MKTKLLALSGALLFAATNAAVAEDITIGFVTVTELTPVTRALDDGFRAEAARRGAKAIVLEIDLADAVGTGIAAMDQLIAQKVDAIAFWPLDDKAMQAPTARAVAAGIPVFAHDLYDDPQGMVVSSVIQGRTLKGTQAAQLVCASAPDEGGKVLYGDFGLPAPTLILLYETFAAELAKCEKPLTVAAKFDNRSDTVEGARPNAEAALLANPGIVAIDSFNDATSIGASIAATSVGVRDQLKIFGYNMGMDGYDALAAKRLDASWDYNAVEIGQRLARVMLDYVEGTNTTPDKFTVVWPTLYTAENLDSFVTQEERIKAVGEGVDLLDQRPGSFTAGATIATTPATEMPLPSLK